MKDCPAKTTTPILSPSLDKIKSLAVFFTTSRRFGKKSSANMLLEISNTSNISITSIFFSTSLSIFWGLAKAIIIRVSMVISIVLRILFLIIPL